MEADNILKGNIADLKQLRTMLEDQNNIKNNIMVMTAEKQKLEKEAEIEEKAMMENIEFTVRKRREQVISNFDNEITKTRDKLKKIRTQREKEKGKKVEARIKNETKDLVQENKNIRDDYRTYMRQRGLSKVWDNKLFMSMFFPKTPVEILIMMATLVMIFILVPVLICNAMGSVWTIFKVIVVLAYLTLIVFILGFMYRFARDDYKAEFLEVRSKQATIMKNKAQINKIKKKIKKDKNEEGYDLGEYDKELKELEDIVEDTAKKKKKALAEFEKKTMSNIHDEIYNRDHVSIDEKKKKATELSSKLKDYEAHLKEVSLKISTNYTAYLGAENMNMEKIEKLIMIMDDGKAATIGEAINVMNTPTL